jgi:glycine cleavage system H protein
MSNVKFTEEHEWLRLEEDGTVTVGITEYAQEQLGDVVFVELPEVGSSVAVGDEVAVVESVKAAGEIKSPLAGEVTTVNELLADEPELVNTTPTGAGWFFTMKPNDEGVMDSLMDETTYKAFLENL